MMINNLHMKGKSGDTESQASPACPTFLMHLLARIKEFLQARGVPSFVVGGYVRDCLLGRAVADIDIAVQASALEVAREFAQAVEGRFIGLDEDHAVARVVLSHGGGSVDFSTLRGGLEADLASRDFTIDAMAISLEGMCLPSGKFSIVDPWGGQQDLEKRLVRAVTPHSFEDDPARLLRAVRLAAEFGFSIEGDTEELIRSSAFLISRVAAERVREELIRLLALPQGAAHLAYLDRLGLLLVLLPELAEMKGMVQPPEHYWDVFEHSLKAAQAVEELVGEQRDMGSGLWKYPISYSSPLTSPGGLVKGEVLAQVPWSESLVDHFSQMVGNTPRRALLKLAGLLHDIAKPQARSVEPSGRIRFLGHPQEGAKLAAAVLERWRFSHRETKLVEAVVLHHLRPAQMAQGDAIPSHRAIYRYFRDVGEAAIDTLFLSLADHWATRGPNLIPEGWAAHASVTKYILEEHFRQESIVRPAKLVDGHDLRAIFGLKPGPDLGRLLESLREAQAAGDIATRDEALAWVKQQMLLGKGEIL